MDSTLTPDTQTVLLLCGELGRRSGNGPKPLGLRQYNNLAAWLKTEGLRPGDLLTSEGRSKLGRLQTSEIDDGRVAPLLDRGAALALIVERWERSNLWVISRSDPFYSQRLKRYLGQSAPPLLYGIGPKDLLNRGGLAVVGSRDRSDEDGVYARSAGEQCAKQEILLISGGAKGIDKDAMDGALDAGGWALGVLAEGLAKTATSGQYRSGLMNDRLTLVSQFDPDLRWLVYNAMDRNKLLYGLSDAALVVASAADTGGTWAGAIEALKLGRIKVFVKSSGTSAPGNSKLIAKGGIPFPAAPWDNLQSIFAGGQEEAQEIAATALPLTGAETEQKILPPEVASVSLRPTASQPEGKLMLDAYTLVIDAIHRSLQEPMTEKLLTAEMNVRAPQMKDWLARAVADGRIEKLKNPVRYIAANPSLFAN